MNYYPTPVSELTDEQIEIFMKEIEDAGITGCDCYEHIEGSWEEQAHDRWSDLVSEQHRRQPPQPGLGMKELSEITLKVLGDARIDRVFEVNPLMYGFKR